MHLSSIRSSVSHTQRVYHPSPASAVNLRPATRTVLSVQRQSRCYPFASPEIISAPQLRPALWSLKSLLALSKLLVLLFLSHSAFSLFRDQTQIFPREEALRRSRFLNTLTALVPDDCPVNPYLMQTAPFSIPPTPPAGYKILLLFIRTGQSKPEQPFAETLRDHSHCILNRSGACCGLYSVLPYLFPS